MFRDLIVPGIKVMGGYRMRENIIEILQYPRYEMHDLLDIEHCPHAGNFNATDTCCLKCDNVLECRWLYENDECAALERKSDASLLAALESALEYVDGTIAELGHNISECQCDACRWLKRAESVYQHEYRALHDFEKYPRLASV